jgi:predicted nucleic acid-binding Zn ribbon protein
MSPRRWRGGPDPGPQPVGQSIERVLGRIGGSPSLVTMEVIFTRWKEVASPSLGDHVRPLRLQDTVLVLAADHSTWASRGRMESAAILARIRELGDTTVERIEVVIERP